MRCLIPCTALSRQYRYKIWMMKSKKWAKGNSDPWIIIDNP
jgi:hypothetical protein